MPDEANNEKIVTESDNKGSGVKNTTETRALTIGLLNVQGLTNSKVIDIANLVKHECKIMCLTETQLKHDKVDIPDGIEKIESMRQLKDRKGGGLLILFERNIGIQITKLATAHSDILHAKVEIASAFFHIILVYFSVINNRKDKERNTLIRKEIESIIDQSVKKEEALMVLGDMNGHIDGLGYQKEDENGRTVLSWMNNFGLTLLNLEDLCSGTFTWGRGNQKSAIDHVLVDRLCRTWIRSMIIDEEKNLYDQSDHNMVCINMSIPKEKIRFKKKNLICREFYRTDDDSLDDFTSEFVTKIVEMEVENIKQFNNIMKTVADEKLKSLYRRRTTDSGNIKEQPWITNEIRKEVKIRQKINRARRNEKDEDVKEHLRAAYATQKAKVQLLVKEAITASEKKTTYEIRGCKNKSKSLWENINKLRKKENKRSAEVHLFDENGKQLDNTEESAELIRYWKTIYQRHKNEIEEVWNNEKKAEYIEKLNCSDDTSQFSDVNNMTPMLIEEEDVIRAVKKMKNKTAPGPDGLKTELYKAIAKTGVGLTALTRCINNAIETKENPPSWKTSKTKMVPKKAKPMAKDLRPIALTDVSYKLCMSVIKEKVENHLEENDEMLETQAGFTRGGRVEDNLFLLSYCVEESYRKKKKTLFVVAVDYSKAFDSVKRGKMIQALKDYKIDPKVIESVASIYTGDVTQIRLNEDTMEEIEVTSGIKQGCTGSTSYFKIVTYHIMKSVCATEKGFRNDHVYIPLLFFADDGLLISQSLKDTKVMLKTLTDSSESFGLNINKEKSAIIIYNSKDQPDEIDGIPVVNSMKYLGVTINNKKNMFREHKKAMMRKTQKMANLTLGIIGKSCNKLMIGKCFWKSLALPSILYGTNIIPISDTEAKQLQVYENSVYRQILGAPRYAPVCTLRGEVGASQMKTRIIQGHLQYLRSTMQGTNELLKEVIRIQLEENKTKWAKTTTEYLRTVQLKDSELKNMDKNTLKNKLRDWDSQQWHSEMSSKTSISMYKNRKKEIKEEIIYDNTTASCILFRARTNTLPLNDRKRHVQETTACELCGAELENIKHFLLFCPALKEQRSSIMALQQPYNEDTDSIVEDFLFDNDNHEMMEEKKKSLYKLWKCRNKK